MNHQPNPLFGVSQRALPSNVMAEQAVLGAIMANPRALDKVIEVLRPEHFVDPMHGRIYREQCRRILGGGIADGVTLLPWFLTDPDAESVSGQVYLSHLMSATMGNLVLPEYAGAIRDTWMRRKLIELGSEVVEGGFLSDLTGDAQIEAAEKMLLDLSSGNRPGGNTCFTLDDAMDAALADADAAAARSGPSGVVTGMASVDEAIGGMEPGTLNILAGRPGMGKTALAVQWWVSAARSGVGVLGFSLEMSAKELARRALAAAAGVPVQDIKRGKHGPHATKLVLARKELSGLPLRIEDGAGLTPTMIAIKARAAARRMPLGLIGLDHLHIVKPEDNDAKHGGTWAVGRVSNSLKRLAKDLDVPVLALAQLSRGVEGRDDKRPTKSDLRYAGDIEQDADTIAFIYRPEYYLPKAPPEHKHGESADTTSKRVDAWHKAKEDLRGKAELIFDKVRDGAECTIHLRFHGETTSFSEPPYGDRSTSEIPDMWGDHAR